MTIQIIIGLEERVERLLETLLRGVNSGYTATEYKGSVVNSGRDKAVCSVRKQRERCSVRRRSQVPVVFLEKRSLLAYIAKLCVTIKELCSNSNEELLSFLTVGIPYDFFHSLPESLFVSGREHSR